jgi:hypothetical protein
MIAINIIQVPSYKIEATASWESLYGGLKQEGEFIPGILIFHLKVKKHRFFCSMRKKSNKKPKLILPTIKKHIASQ